MLQYNNNNAMNNQGRSCIVERTITIRLEDIYMYIYSKVRYNYDSI